MLVEFIGHSDSLRSATFSSDGARILTGSMDQTARLWDAKSGALLSVLEGHNDPIVSVAISPDGSRALTAGSSDFTARLWELSIVAEPYMPPNVDRMDRAVMEIKRSVPAPQ